jgi:DNA-binding CsgD family transcriptional regulator
MAALRERDLRAVLDFVGDAYDAQDRTEFRAVLLPGLRRLIPSDYVSYNEVEAGNRVAIAVNDPELPKWAHEAWDRHAGENPLLQRYLQTRDGRSLRFSDVVSLEQLRSTELFAELYGPLGDLERQMACVLPSTPALTVAFAFSRAGRDYSDRERRLLELARPHLIQAYRAAELRERLAGVLESLGRGLDADDTAMIVVDAAGVVGFLSGPAAGLLAGLPGSSTPRVGEPIGEPLAGWLEEGRMAAALPIPGQADSLLVRGVKGAGGARVILLERAATVLSLSTLRELGLTPREAEVLHGLARGDSAEALAAELQVAPRTVAKHVQRLHAKLGVSNRTQAVATAWAATGGARGSVPRVEAR